MEVNHRPHQTRCKATLRLLTQGRTPTAPPQTDHTVLAQACPHRRDAAFPPSTDVTDELGFEGSFYFQIKNTRGLVAWTKGACRLVLGLLYCLRKDPTHSAQSPPPPKKNTKTSSAQKSRAGRRGSKDTHTQTQLPQGGEPTPQIQQLPLGSLDLSTFPPPPILP